MDISFFENKFLQLVFASGAVATATVSGRTGDLQRVQIDRSQKNFKKTISDIFPNNCFIDSLLAAFPTLPPPPSSLVGSSSYHTW